MGEFRARNPPLAPDDAADEEARRYLPIRLIRVLHAKSSKIMYNFWTVTMIYRSSGRKFENFDSS